MFGGERDRACGGGHCGRFPQQEGAENADVGQACNSTADLQWERLVWSESRSFFVKTFYVSIVYFLE